MYRGVVVYDKSLLEAIAYWKVKSHNPENLKDIASNKEEYLLELAKGSYEGLSYIVHRTSIKKELEDLNVTIHQLRTSERDQFLVGKYLGVHHTIFEQLPYNLTPMDQLETNVQELLQNPLNNWMAKEKENIDKGLSILGLDEFPINNYFAGEGGGPMDLNGPPSVIPEMRSKKME